MIYSTVTIPPKTYRYDIPRGKHDFGGTLVIDETGMFAAFTDYGNYQRWWPWDERERKRMDFRQFILGLAESCAKGYCDYLLGKIAKESELDDEDLRRRLNEIRLEHYQAYMSCRRKKCTECKFNHHSTFRPRPGCETKEFDYKWAARELEAINEITDSSSMHVYYGGSRMLVDWTELPRMTYDSDAKHFANLMMPRLVPIIKKDLARAV